MWYTFYFFVVAVTFYCLFQEFSFGLEADIIKHTNVRKKKRIKLKCDTLATSSHREKEHLHFFLFCEK